MCLGRGTVALGGWGDHTVNTWLTLTEWEFPGVHSVFASEMDFLTKSSVVVFVRQESPSFWRKSMKYLKKFETQGKHSLLSEQLTLLNSKSVINVIF